MKRRILSLVLVLAMMLSVGVFAQAASTPADARQGVAVVVEFINYIDQGFQEAVALGSCFFIGHENEDPQYLITNHHVIEDYLDLGGGNIVTVSIDGVKQNIKTILRVYFDSKDYVEAYPVDFNISQDFAVLRLDRPTDQRVALPIQIPDEGLVGDEVFAIGYPGIADNWIDDPTSIWGVNDSMVSKSTLGRFYTTSGTGDQWLQMTDASWYHGNSGGPILTELGNVVGLVSGSVHNSTEEAYSAVDIRPVVTMLKNNNISFDIRDPEAEAVAAAEAELAAKAEEEARLAAEAATKAEEDRLAAEAEAAAKAEEEARLAAEAAAKAEEEARLAAEAATKAEEERLAAEAAAKKKQMIIIGAAGAAALVVILVLVILLAKKKKAPVQPVQPIAQPIAQPAPSKAVVRSMAAQHRGGSVPVGSRAINIGRDPSCAVVFGSGTPGVSGVHCSLYYEASSRTFVLTDLKSTYGTYLMTGMKLTPNVPYKLKNGDSFYLGEAANTLRVEVE